MPRYTFVLISGSPGPLDPDDKDHHDHSWSSFVTPPLLLDKKGGFVKPDEKVVWYVYKPGYVARWLADVKNPFKKDYVKKATDDVKAKGFADYVSLIEGRAREKGWALVWLEAANELWDKIKYLQDLISRTYYWGHARNDLWLSLDHRRTLVPAATGGPRPNLVSEAVSPDPKAILPSADIRSHSMLQPRFLPNEPSRVSRFIGCNTRVFAGVWAETFKVHTEGVDGKVNFESIYKDGEPSTVGDAKRRVCRPTGCE
jgi:hypothetical protein